MERSRAVRCFVGISVTALFMGIFVVAISSNDLAGLTAPHARVTESPVEQPQSASGTQPNVVGSADVNGNSVEPPIKESPDRGILSRFIDNMLARSPQPKTETAFDDSSDGKVGSVVDDNPRASPASVNHPGWLQATGSQCWVWDPEPQIGEAVTWTGKCDRAGRATGHGLLVWLLNGEPGERYDVDMVKGRMNGRGIAVIPDGSRYEGEYKNNMRNGIGIVTFKDGSRYEGNFRDDIRSGHGVFKNALNEIYDGDWAGDRMDGHGVFKWPDGTTYDGEFKFGVPAGHGVKKSPNGTRYEGEFKDGVMNGLGTKDTPNGTHYEVIFKNGHMNGHGYMVSRDGTRFEGEFKDDQPVSQPAKSSKAG
jgi:hypothetical protein